MASSEETRVIHQVSARLRSRFPEVAYDDLRRTVEAAYHELDSARIRDFVEILVERSAADVIDHEAV
jgi:hypothetical protein